MDRKQSSCACRRNHGNTLITLMVAFIAATLFLYSCKNDDTSGKQRTEQQQKALSLLDDSINVMSPSAPAMAAKGMKTAADSLSFYEYAVRAATISGVYNKSDSCFTLSKKALSYALKIKDKTARVNELIGRCYSNLGSFYFAIKMDPVSGLRYGKLAYDYMMASDGNPNICDICANIADDYTQTNDMAQSAKWFRRGLFLADSLHLPESTNTSIYLGLAQVYTYLRDFDTALYYYTRTDRRINDLRPNMRIYFLNNFGNFYFFKQDYKMALKQFRRVVKTLHEYGMDNSLDMKICRVNMADVFQNLNQNDSARIYLTGLEDYFKANKLDAGSYYVNTIKIALALKDDNVAEARRILNSEKVGRMDYSDMTNIRNKYLLNFYVKSGDYRKAFESLRQTTQYNDSIEKSKSHVRTSEILMRFSQDTLALHKQINIDEKNHQVNQAHWLLGISSSVVIILVLIVVIIIVNTRRQKAEREIDILKLRMANIRNRISPHFIFNVLNHEIIGRQNNPESSQLESLTMLIRDALNISRKPIVTLREELDFVKKFIPINTSTLGDDFTFNVDMAPDVNQDAVHLPSMFVQTLAENAIKHGLKLKEGPKSLLIKVVKTNDGYINIDVVDNGVGFDATTQSSNGTGTGLNVIRQTIIIMNSHSKRKMRFNICNDTDEEGKIKGCRASLRIPDNLS
jgi:tetratricopeptide (TPR) repeat protein